MEGGAVGYGYGCAGGLEMGLVLTWISFVLELCFICPGDGVWDLA